MADTLIPVVGDYGSSTDPGGVRELTTSETFPIAYIPIITPAKGGTGVANGTNNTITFTGNYTLGVTLSANTAVTFPTSGTLAVLGANTFTGNQTLSDNQLSRAMIKDCGFVYYDSTTTNALDYTNGSHQRWSPSSGAQTLSITNWPPSGNLGELLIEGINLATATITWPTINWLKTDGSTTTTFSSTGVTLQTSGTDWVFLWSRDAGTTIYGKVIR